jgi:PAS domain S-box-containing protein
MTIGDALLQEISDHIAKELGAVVSFMREQGRIVVSSERRRIGQVHELAARIMSGEVDFLEVTREQAASSKVMREGVILPLDMDGVRETCVGVAAPLELARPYARIAQGWIYSHLKAAQAESDRRRALIETEAQIRDILEACPASCACVDLGGQLLFHNARLREIMEYSKEELDGIDTKLFWVDLDHRARLIDKLKAQDGELRDEEIQLKTKTGKIKWVLISYTKVSFHGASRLGWFYEITDRKRQEEELHVAKESAETALSQLKETQAKLIQSEKMAALGKLTAGIAHEIKNPLNFVNNFAETSVELLDELSAALAPALDKLGDDARDEAEEVLETLTSDLSAIAKHGKRADSIVKSMLLHARGDLAERRAIDVNGLIEETLGLAYHGERARNREFNIIFERDFDPKIEPVELSPQEITRVLVNLCNNAFYATEKRKAQSPNSDYEPVMRVATKELGDQVEITILDNGSGIPKSVIDEVFSPFFTTKDAGEGTGLGLSLSHDVIVAHHKGSFTVRSEEGEFTEFTIRLPHSIDGRPQQKREEGPS